MGTGGQWWQSSNFQLEVTSMDVSGFSSYCSGSMSKSLSIGWHSHSFIDPVPQRTPKLIECDVGPASQERRPILEVEQTTSKV